MKIIFGLGNPGGKYENNYHNLGFMAIDAIAKKIGVDFNKKGRQGVYGEKNINGEKIILVKPQTYMNNSGQSVRAVMDFYRLSPADVVVFHDDLDLAFAKVKAKIGGGAGGHNGLKSVDAHCTPNYTRVRIGIGRPADKSDVVKYVLSDFSKAEKDALNGLFDEIGEAFPVLLQDGTGAFSNRLALVQNKNQGENHGI